MTIEFADREIEAQCRLRRERSDSTEENRQLLRSYLEKFGRPLAFYRDKASLFQTAEKRKRDEPGVEKDAVEMPPTQIGRALRELGITWIAAHSPQAKRELAVEAASSDDAHRPLDKSYNLAASLSQVEARRVRNHYTLKGEGKLYQIERRAAAAGASLRVEQRLDGSRTVGPGERHVTGTRISI